jgi:hypothetical protein
MAQLRALAAKITRLLDEQMILEHFLSHKLGQKALVRGLVNLHELRFLARHLSDLVEEFDRSVISFCGKDASSEDGFTVVDNGFDEFACGCISDMLAGFPVLSTYQHRS